MRGAREEHASEGNTRGAYERERSMSTRGAREEYECEGRTITKGA